MSKPTSVILLCEDKRTAVFVRSYLKERGVSHGIRIHSNPSGSGFDWVLDQYPIEVNAYRQNKGRLKIWLIVVIDADNKSVGARLNQLDTKLGQAENARLLDLRIEDESIARLVPRRNIETWILVLTGTPANEEENYKNTRNKEEWHELAIQGGKELHRWTRPNSRISESCTDSLHRGIQELRRVEDPTR